MMNLHKPKWFGVSEKLIANVFYVSSQFSKPITFDRSKKRSC